MSGDVARSWIEYAVRTADGYIDTTPDDLGEAVAEVERCRRAYAGDSRWAGQYEGAEIVVRRVTTTAWHGLNERCPGHALSACEPCHWPVEWPDDRPGAAS